MFCAFAEARFVIQDLHDLAVSIELIFGVSW